jgi:hypothetical protein
MASGVLGKANVAANTTTTIYTAPNTTGLISVVNMSIVNLSETSPTNVSVKIQPGGISIENNTTLNAKEGFARSCGVLGPGEYIEVTSSAAAVAVVVNGIEKIGFTGGTLKPGTLTQGTNQTYTAPNSSQAEYVMLDYNVVNMSGSVESTYSVKIDGIPIEFKTSLSPNTGVFRALGPISPSSTVNIECITGGPLIYRLSGRLY